MWYDSNCNAFVVTWFKANIDTGPEWFIYKQYDYGHSEYLNTWKQLQATITDNASYIWTYEDGLFSLNTLNYQLDSNLIPQVICKWDVLSLPTQDWYDIIINGNPLPERDLENLPVGQYLINYTRCEHTTSFVVDVVPQPTITNITQTVEENCQIQVQASVSDTSWLWKFQRFDADGNVIGDAADIYRLATPYGEELTFVYTVGSCEVSQSVFVQESPSPVLDQEDIVSNPFVDFLNRINVSYPQPCKVQTASQFLEFIQNDTQTIYLEQNWQKLSPDDKIQSGNLLVYVIDENGCKAAYDFVITIGQDMTVVSNVFTPNGDGFNDTFFVPDACWNQLDFTAYNRQWSKVFATDINNKERDWAKLPAGTYYIQWIDANGDAQKWRVSILRD